MRFKLVVASVAAVASLMGCRFKSSEGNELKDVGVAEDQGRVTYYFANSITSKISEARCPVTADFDEIHAYRQACSITKSVDIATFAAILKTLYNQRFNEGANSLSAAHQAALTDVSTWVNSPAELLKSSDPTLLEDRSLLHNAASLIPEAMGSRGGAIYPLPETRPLAKSSLVGFQAQLAITIPPGLSVTPALGLPTPMLSSVISLSFQGCQAEAVAISGGAQTGPLTNLYPMSPLEGHRFAIQNGPLPLGSFQATVLNPSVVPQTCVMLVKNESAEGSVGKTVGAMASGPGLLSFIGSVTALYQGTMTSYVHIHLAMARFVRTLQVDLGGSCHGVKVTDVRVEASPAVKLTPTTVNASSTPNRIAFTVNGGSGVAIGSVMAQVQFTSVQADQQTCTINVSAN